MKIVEYFKYMHACLCKVTYYLIQMVNIRVGNGLFSHSAGLHCSKMHSLFVYLRYKIDSPGCVFLTLMDVQ